LEEQQFAEAGNEKLKTNSLSIDPRWQIEIARVRAGVPGTLDSVSSSLSAPRTWRV